MLQLYRRGSFQHTSCGQLHDEDCSKMLHRGACWKSRYYFHQAATAVWQSMPRMSDSSCTRHWGVWLRQKGNKHGRVIVTMEETYMLPSRLVYLLRTTTISTPPPVRWSRAQQLRSCHRPGDRTAAFLPPGRLHFYRPHCHHPVQQPHSTPRVLPPPLQEVTSIQKG